MALKYKEIIEERVGVKLEGVLPIEIKNIIDKTRKNCENCNNSEIWKVTRFWIQWVTCMNLDSNLYWLSNTSPRTTCEKYS